MKKVRWFVLLLSVSVLSVSALAGMRTTCAQAWAEYEAGGLLSQEHVYGAEVELDRGIAEVWAVLEDFKRYPEWNPMSVEVHTDGVVGHTMWLKARMQDGSLRKVRERLMAFESPNGQGFACLSWRVPFPENILAGGHRWQFLVDLGGGRTRYVSYERLSGMFVRLVDRKFGPGVKKNYLDLMEALKRRVFASLEN